MTVENAGFIYIRGRKWNIECYHCVVAESRVYAYWKHFNPDVIEFKNTELVFLQKIGWFVQETRLSAPEDHPTI